MVGGLTFIRCHSVDYVYLADVILAFYVSDQVMLLALEIIAYFHNLATINIVEVNED